LINLFISRQPVVFKRENAIIDRKILISAVKTIAYIYKNLQLVVFKGNFLISAVKSTTYNGFAYFIKMYTRFCRETGKHLYKSWQNYLLPRVLLL